MDLLEDTPALNLFDHTWRIYSVNPNEPPQYIAPYAQVKESLVNEGCIVEGNVEHSVLFQGVYVSQGAKVKDCVVMPNAVIGKNVYIEKRLFLRMWQFLMERLFVRINMKGKSFL